MERELRDQLLRLLENNSKLSSQDLAVMLGAAVEEVANEISVLEQEHDILQNGSWQTIHASSRKTVPASIH